MCKKFQHESEKSTADYYNYYYNFNNYYNNYQNSGRGRSLPEDN